MKLIRKMKQILKTKENNKMITENKKPCRLEVNSLTKNKGVMRASILILIFLTGCSELSLDSLSTDSLSKVQSVGAITDVKPKIGNVDIAQAASAAKDLSEAAMLSEEEVAQMALGYAKHSDQTNKIAQNGSSYVTRLNKLMSKHTNEDGLKLNYKVYISKDVNAFALADGSVRVYSGLMDLMDDQEILAVLGHEIGHVKLGHSANRIRLANATSGLKKAVGSTSTIAGAVANEELLGGMIEKVINSQFSQSQETESDEYAVGFLKKNGYNLNAAVTAFNKLAELDGESSFADKILSSHPASEERAKHLAEIIGNGGEVQIASKIESKTEANDKSQTAKEDIKEQASTETKSFTKTDSIEQLPPASNKQVSATLGKHSINTGWYVQVAAKTEENAALLLKSELKHFGFDAVQQEAVVNGIKYYRVVVGPFNQQAEAYKTKQKVMDSSITNEEPFVRLIK